MTASTTTARTYQIMLILVTAVALDASETDQYNSTVMADEKRNEGWNMRTAESLKSESLVL